MKDVGLRIRVQRDLRDAFLAACRKEDKPAAPEPVPLIDRPPVEKAEKATNEEEEAWVRRLSELRPLLQTTITCFQAGNWMI